MIDHPVIEALEDLLERESRGLLSGDLDAVTRLADRKEDLLRRIPSVAHDAEALARLRHAAVRNAGLLAAAAQGVRAAGQRIRTLIEGPAPLTTYDLYGRKNPIPAHDGDTPRRV